MNSEQVLEKLKIAGKITDEDIREASLDIGFGIVSTFHTFLCNKSHDDKSCGWYVDSDAGKEWDEKLIKFADVLKIGTEELRSIVIWLATPIGVDLRKLLPALCSIFLNFGPEVFTEHTASSSDD